MSAPLKVAVIAGESSGDLLGADLVAALRSQADREIELVGVGGPALTAAGMQSLFDFAELSIMGVTAVLKKLPRLVRLIGKTADEIVKAEPDVLVIIDSPDFTHRVARKVREKLPNLPIVNYVCPSVWAWKEYRAKDMLGYVDHVLAVLPFEPEVMARLGGPPTTYIGHRLRSLERLLEARAEVESRRAAGQTPVPAIALLPGSRGVEIRRLLPLIGSTLNAMTARGRQYRLLLPAVPHQVALVRGIVADWPQKPEIFVGESEKWAAFSQADAALAASGTVLLELALTGIPALSIYKTDFWIRLVLSRIKTWSGALPNLIADYPLMPEYFDEFIRPAMLARSMEQLVAPTPMRAAMLAGYQTVFDRMRTERPAGDAGAAIVLDLVANRKASRP
ncbi:lipid-A-disaccharide synthase [Rhizobium sp. KVB221]|uniref:Lipid-A-disaccharide synthase n=1 Tax=Rhizobium setariae TaxID=2801340 RepID=A0A937CPU8_9HYPH|nr:lipid-A-disaccharide synthase [Rhizobium setariae]MBL0372998.1 lipid-A-disaccharide synthase [Rhizobium setariae]